jgi:molybdopterin-binding protein
LPTSLLGREREVRDWEAHFARRVIDETKLSARNEFKGKIVDGKKGSITSHVRIDIGQGVIVTFSITNATVADLDLKMGDEAWAVIKASDVMMGK